MMNQDVPGHGKLCLRFAVELGDHVSEILLEAADLLRQRHQSVHKRLQFFLLWKKGMKGDLKSTRRSCQLEDHDPCFLSSIVANFS